MRNTPTITTFTTRFINRSNAVPLALLESAIDAVDSVLAISPQDAAALRARDHIEMAMGCVLEISDIS